MSAHQIVMQAKGLIKRYGQVTALDGADFELRAGEILAVIGDNGAGKSSLIKCLSGATIPDEGEIQLDGKVIHFKSPIDARMAGIETVYQDLAVAPAMSIAENLFLGRELRRSGLLGLLGFIDKKKMLDESISRMNDLKVGIRSMTQAVETLSGGQRQCVAVGRAAAFAQHVVIMDEPTAALGVKEGNMVLELKIPRAQVVATGWTKMMILTHHDALGGTKDSALAIMETARSMSCSALKSMLNNSSKVAFHASLTAKQLSFVKRVMRDHCGGEFVGRKFLNSGDALVAAMKYIDKTLDKRVSIA